MKASKNGAGMKPAPCVVALLLAVSCLLPAKTACAAESQDGDVINLLYNERAPLHYTGTDGKVKGLLVTPTENAFNAAGIAFRWQRRPVARIMLTLKENAGRDCAAGWYKTPERAEFARYSLPIYTELPSVGVVRADYKVAPGITARQLLLASDTKLLIKLGINYGADLNDLLAQMPHNRVQIVTEEVPTLFKMLAYGRADMTFSTREELDEAIRESGVAAEKFKLLEFPDHTHGELRYILCDFSVPAETMNKLDAAIRALKLAQP